MSKEGQQYLHSLFIYCPLTGLMINKCDRGTTSKKHSLVGTIHNGYFVIGLDKKQYRLHRVIWYYMTGDWPDVIDHIDGNKENNKWTNLRSGTKQENCQNLISHRQGRPLGVTYSERDKTWIARSTSDINGARKHIGCFNTMEQAAEAVLKYKETNG